MHNPARNENEAAAGGKKNGFASVWSRIAHTPFMRGRSLRVLEKRSPRALGRRRTPVAQGHASGRRMVRVQVRSEVLLTSVRRRSGWRPAGGLASGGLRG